MHPIWPKRRVFKTEIQEDDRGTEEVEFVQGPSLEEEMAMEEESEDEDRRGEICSIDGWEHMDRCMHEC